jgi:predicted HicB family RNase H-like nuclease
MIIKHWIVELATDGYSILDKKPQKPYSGSLNIRIPSEVHSQLALKAQMTGRSINAIIKDLLTNRMNQSNA